PSHSATDQRRNNFSTLQRAYGNQAALRRQQRNHGVGTLAAPAQGGLLQRKCACGDTVGSFTECAECQKKQEVSMQRRNANPSEPGIVQPVVHEVTRSSGQLPVPASPGFMLSSFGHDLNHITVFPNRWPSYHQSIYEKEPKDLDFC